MDDRSRLETAWVCWAVPAFVGVGATLFHWFSDDQQAVVLGLLCLPVGVLLFFVGFFNAVAAKTGRRGLVILLLLGNFPLALACAWVGLQSHMAVSVKLVNDSAQTIDAVATFDGAVAERRAIPPNGSATLTLRLRATERSEFLLNVGLGSQTEQIMIGSYDADDLLGGMRRVRVRVTNDGFGPVVDLP